VTAVPERRFSRSKVQARPSLLEVDDLARILGRSVRAIKRDVRHDPERLPPRLQLPGTKLLRWRQEDVEEWLLGLPLTRARRP
jgi:predicted DNA-binding transcriptional regulator AlpA